VCGRMGPKRFPLKKINDAGTTEEAKTYTSPVVTETNKKGRAKGKKKVKGQRGGSWGRDTCTTLWEQQKKVGRPKKKKTCPTKGRLCMHKKGEKIDGGLHYDGLSRGGRGS